MHRPGGGVAGTHVTRLVIVASAAIGLILLVGFIATRLARSRSRGLSIRLQVFVALAAIVGAFAFGLGVMVLDRIDARAQRFAVLSATEQAQLVAKLVRTEIDTRPKTLDEVTRELLAPVGPNALVGVQVLDRNGRELFRGDSEFPRSGIPSVSADAEIMARGELQGWVRVTKTTVQIEALLRDFAPTVLVISLILGAAAALSAAWIGHTIAGPIEALTVFSEKVAAGDHRATAPAVFNGREVMRLTHSLDSMRRQLEGRPFVETFATDLSHELKNPVAAIRASAEVLDDSALEEPETARRFVRRIRESVARIERLLGELLSLAHIEARGVRDFAPVDLGELVTAAVRGSDQEGRVELTAQSDVRVRGDRLWLTRAVSNLIDNALIHGGSTVTVHVERAGDDAIVRVENDGSIDKHTRSRLFGRFVTTRANEGGTGLGLAITRAVAEAHRGHIELTHPGPPRVCFELTLPSA